MSLPRTVADVIASHVTLELESLDRVYLNVYQPKLQTPRAVFYFLREHYGEGAVSSHQMKAITEQFLQNIDDYALEHQIEVITFAKGQRKEHLAAKYLATFPGTEGVLFIGKAQEKVRTFRTEGRRNERGETYPWIVDSTAMVNQYYFYAVDEDFGPFFLKYSSYFPYGAKLCFNGHEYLKRQLAKEGIGYEELANGILSCDNPRRMQSLADGLTPRRIERFLRKWQDRLPCPFSTRQQAAGYRYEASMCQVEFALTQVVERPVHGRIFFEEVLRENLDLGRPDNMQLIFEHRVTKRTPGSFRTRSCPRGCDPVTPRGLQIEPHQAVLQGVPRLAHGVDRAQPAGLRTWSQSGKSSGVAEAWFSNQPTRVARPNDQPGLRDVRRIVPRSDRSAPRGRPAGLGFALRRPESAGAIGRVGDVSAVALWISQS